VAHEGRHAVKEDPIIEDAMVCLRWDTLLLQQDQERQMQKHRHETEREMFYRANKAVLDRRH
jgi:hypothetical protein